MDKIVARYKRDKLFLRENRSSLTPEAIQYMNTFLAGLEYVFEELGVDKELI